MKEVKSTSIASMLAFATLFSIACSDTSSKSESMDSTEVAEIFFDDFSYRSVSEFEANNWQIRSGGGHPGDKRAYWEKDNVSFHHSEDGDQSFVRLRGHVNGGVNDTGQAQICHMRKYKEGTYAARVYFRDQPTDGPDGDQVIQTFYTISPLKSPMNLDYSEMDFEYLPNGGWGQEQAFWVTTWETFQHEPWTQDNEHGFEPGSYEGWRTLMIHAMDSTVTYYVDGKEFFKHSERVFPEEPMSINFNLWFVENQLVESKENRFYEEDLDWVFFKKNEALTTTEVEARVADHRSKGSRYVDSVAPWSPVLESECSL